jgi:methylthioribulose-1-phosphate dehydratase
MSDFTVSGHLNSNFNDIADAIIAAGKTVYANGWVPATSGNFSCRYSDDAIAITVSGQHKGKLDRDGLMIVNMKGVSECSRRSSAETGLHLALYKRYDWAGCVLHVHSLSTIVLSRLCADSIRLRGMELFKAFRGIDTHDLEIQVPVFDNSQNIGLLSRVVDRHLDTADIIVPGYVIRGHGIYAWGETVDETMRHLEAFDYLFQCELETMRISNHERAGHI